MTEWIDVGDLNDVPLRGARVIKTAQGCIAVFRTAEAEAYALRDACPHTGGPLSEGIVHGRSVTCPLHNWVISLETGQAQGADDGATETFAVKIEGGRLLLDRASLAAVKAA